MKQIDREGVHANGQGLCRLWTEEQKVHRYVNLTLRIKSTGYNQEDTNAFRFRSARGTVASKSSGRCATEQVKLLGVLSSGGIPGLISNPEVKPASADGTWMVTSWERRSSPSYFTFSAAHFPSALFCCPFPLFLNFFFIIPAVHLLNSHSIKAKTP